MSHSAGHRARKRFGQNFLHDMSVIHRLDKSIAAKAGDNIVEIGPGQGALTEPLLNALDHLNVVEIDRDLVLILKEKFAGRPLTVHSNDALTFDFRSLFDERPLRVVGNLPYNISTPLLLHLLGYGQKIQDMHFMLQLEVVDRLSAKPGNKTYGRLSIVSQYYCQIDKLFHVPPSAFHPPPKVMSAIVRLAPRPFQIPASDVELFKHVVKTSFSQRRKTLRNNLKQILNGEQLEQLTNDGVCDLSLRPEQLSVDQYVILSNAVAAMPDINKK